MSADIVAPASGGAPSWGHGNDPSMSSLGAVIQSGSPDRPLKQSLVFAEFAEQWLAQEKRRLRPNSFRIYRSYLRHHIIPFMGARMIETITVDDVAALVGAMAAGIRYRPCAGGVERVNGDPLSPTTIACVLTVLGRIFGRAARYGIIDGNPVRRLERDEVPKRVRRRFPCLDRDAIGRLIAHTPQRFRTLLALSVLTGIRQGEALGLRWQDIDIESGVLYVRFQLTRTGELAEPKTSASRRDVPIPPSLGRLLANHKELAHGRGRAGPTDLIFCSPTGQTLDRRNVVRRGLEPALAGAGIPHLTWHDLRHVAASALIAEGASVPYLARVLGHSSPAVTLAIYAHEFARAEHADRTRDRMEAAFGDLLA